MGQETIIGHYDFLVIDSCLFGAAIAHFTTSGIKMPQSSENYQELKIFLARFRDFYSLPLKTYLLCCLHFNKVCRNNHPPHSLIWNGEGGRL